MKIGESSKLIVCCLALVSACFLGWLDKISGDSLVGIIMGCLGYVFGNSHGIISAKQEKMEVYESENTN